MRKRTRSILEELNQIHRTTNNDALIQSTGNNLIESAINLLNRIAESYDQETAQELERRFINSIRSGDPRKFKRGVDKIIESKQKDDDNANS
jgi:hypothetical protein|tara:strand:+ start:1508 stop:1783 length:276 start_codon:yes stop_codon:yes gene_type:complete